MLCVHTKQIIVIGVKNSLRISTSKKIHYRLRHTGDCLEETLSKHEEAMRSLENEFKECRQEAQQAFKHYKFTTQNCRDD